MNKSDDTLTRMHGLRASLYNDPWMLASEADLGVLVDQIEAATIRAANGEFTTADDHSALYETIGDGVAVIPAIGTISRRSSFFSFLFGGATLDNLEAALDEATADTSVNEIVIQFNSPGGSVDGIFATAAKIQSLSIHGDKTIRAFVETAASAAYLLASQCDEIIIQPGGMAGSIGVIAKVPDTSRLEKNLGIDTRIFRSTPGKAPGVGPMTETAAEAMQKQVDSLFARFRDAVSDVRSHALSIDAVSTGETWLDHDAVEIGIADRVATFDELIFE
jgi:ClpP class serine protease